MPRARGIAIKFNRGTPPTPPETTTHPMEHPYGHVCASSIGPLTFMPRTVVTRSNRTLFPILTRYDLFFGKSRRELLSWFDFFFDFECWFVFFFLISEGI